MITLFEYGLWERTNNKSALNLLLKDIWKQRLFLGQTEESPNEKKDSHYQPFLQFDNEQIRANNFVGFIQNGEETIEIYPKVFRKHLPNPDKNDKALMLKHIFYWFSYCRKWNFPFNQASLETTDIDELPELIINLIANQFNKIVSEQPLTMYQEVEEVSTYPKGTINFKRYISKSLSHGNFQNIEYDYEPFLFDNKVNRVIKYCTRLLMNQTKFSENLRVLQDTVFILDEVEDRYCTVNDIEGITLNSFFDDYSKVLDSCKLILSHQIYSSQTDDLSQWCLLFPMEYIFEDFLAGFLETKFSKEWKIEYQKSDEYLSNTPRVFNMQHDIFLTSRKDNTRKIIIDTKYKIREDNFKSDPKKGVQQSDLYQMVSYAFKRGCTELILVYPNISDFQNPSDEFEIISGFARADKIKVRAIEVPFCSLNDFKNIESNLYNVLLNELN
jgi:5-methylcytosine-specific restriction enzyme subunit McrC